MKLGPPSGPDPMITIDQIQKLDRKVQAAVRLIGSLREENNSLKSKLDAYQKRIGELEVLIDQFKKDQIEIEDGIVSALAQLDQLEDSLEDSDSAQLESKMPEKKEIENADQQTSENDAADENELDIF